MFAADLQSERALGGSARAGSPPSRASAKSPADDALSVASTASLAGQSWASASALGRAAASAFARADAFTSGAAAVLHVAGQLSDTVFSYPLLAAGASPDERNSGSEPPRARVVPLEIRAGAGAAVQGAQAAGARVSALLPSQPLPLFVPALRAMATSGRPAVVHLSCEALRRADLAVGGSVEALDALAHAGGGPLLLAAASAQECHDMAVVAHVAAARLRKLAVHFFDGARVAREHAKLSLLTPEALRRLDAAVSVSASASSDLPPPTANVAEQVQAVMDDLFPVLQRQYSVYEYFGAPDATRVVVVMGDAAAAVKQAVGYEQMLGEKVGVLQVRLLLPWSHALFARALPASAQRVAVLENISREALDMQRGALLSRHVQVFFQSPYWAGKAASPEVVTGIYGGAFRNVSFSAGMARAVLHRLSDASDAASGFRRRRAFVVAKSEPLYDAALEAAGPSNAAASSVRAPLDVVFGDRFDGSLGSGAAAYSKQFVLWGFDDDDQRSGAGTHALFAATLELLAKNPATQVHALVTHSTSAADASAPRPASALQVRVGPHGQGGAGGVSGPFEPVEQADVVVVTRAELLKAYDVVQSVKPGGSLLVLAPWKTSDDVDEADAFKVAVAARGVRLLTVDAVELATRVEDHSVAAVGPLVAFFKAAQLLDERVVLALLSARFPADQQATLKAFVSAVWGDTNALPYPAEAWRQQPAVEEGEEAAAPLPSLLDVRPAALSFATSASAVASKKRALRQPSASSETRAAWQFTFPEAFGAATRVRDHVTDLVTVTKWKRLTPEDYSRNVFHVEMDTTDTRIEYKIGEALAVFAHNDDKDVLAFLRGYNVDPEALVTIPAATKAKGKKGEPKDAVPTGETLTYFQLFSHVLDIFGRPSKKFYEALAARATDDKEQEALAALLAPEGKDEYKRRVDETVTFAELLDEFKSARPSMQDLVALVPRIKARHYSIASSMKMNPTSVHLLIVVHDWTTPSGKYRVGQATRFLASVKVGQKLSVSVCSSVMKLPKNHADPIIMAGLGTGMAPFRAFIQERAFLRSRGVAVGPIALYFGSRSKKQEYLYGDELDAYVRDGLVTLLRCAFSRDQPHKVYIQDKIAEDKETLSDWMLHRNGHFYLCGPTWPVADVRAALLDAFEQVGGLDKRHAGQALERMRDQGRYVLEVY